jgi:hypothetical protein
LLSPLSCVLPPFKRCCWTERLGLKFPL